MMARSAIKKKKKKILEDPFASREAHKYDRPIPSREFIQSYLDGYGYPVTFNELANGLNLSEQQDLDSLQRRLNAMIRDGQLLQNRLDRYCLIKQTDLILGRVVGHRDGFGFIRPDDNSDDLFLSPREMRALMHNDRVLVRIKGIDRRGRKEASVVKVLERNTHRVVGRLYNDRGVFLVIPDNKNLAKDILVPETGRNGAEHGQIVVVQIIKQPNKRAQPVGKVIEVLGEHMAPGMEIEIAIRSYDLPCEWPESVMRKAHQLGSTVSRQDKISRENLRNLPLITIDGEDARDFDDAVYCNKTVKGWRLLVAIADVSHYVLPDSELDREAYHRGNSVYFPDHVIPMLPEVLSNGLCSLNPNEDRLCVVCEIYVSATGKINRTRFFQGVMRSHERMTYTEVAEILAKKKKALLKKYNAVLACLDNLFDLYQVLRKGREDRGAIDFDTQEQRIIFGKGRKIEKIVPLVRNDAHCLIEECMILANIASARFLRRKKIPHLLRVHKGPTEEKINDLRSFLAELGLSIKGGKNPTPADYSRLLRRIQSRPDKHLIQTVMLRSLAQAVYSPEQLGHFGLALESYTHFTSPIRRYPDLIVHRAIKYCLANQPVEDFRYSFAGLGVTGEHCSETERRADHATRDVLSWLKCEYMLDKLGEEFSGIISGVTSFGFFVELDGIFVEGLVHVATLDRDYFHFDPVLHCLYGERSGVSYRLGDRIRVRVTRVDLDERKIDFELVESRKKKLRRR